MPASSLLHARPRLAAIVVLLLAVAGLAALDALPRREDPELTHRWAVATIALPGADAARVERDVVEPAEAVLLAIPEIKTMTARAQAGVALIDIQLEDDIHAVEEVWAEVRSLLTEARARMPAETGQPSLEISTTSAFSLLIGVTWTIEGPVQLDLMNRIAATLERRLAALPGVQETAIYGEPEEEILVSADPARLAEAGLSVEALAAALAGAEARAAAGRVEGPATETLIEVEAGFGSVEGLRRLALRTGADGAVLRLGDVAEVSRRPRDPPPAVALVDGRPAIVVGAKMQTDRRIDRWTEATLADVDRFAATVPEGVGLDVLFRQSVHTEARLDGLVLNLGLGVGLVLAVLFAMMGWRSALIVASSLPLTLLAVLALFALLGVPLHQVSITGLIIALGLLIDNAIIAVHTYDEMRRRSAGAAEAIAQTVRYLRLPLTASTLTTILAFLPLVVAPGNAGEFVSTLGIGVILAVACSLALSLGLLPAVAGWLDRTDGDTAENPRRGSGGRALASLVRLSLRAPAAGIAVALALPLAGFALAPQLVGQLFPPAERDQFLVRLALPRSVSIEETRRSAMQVREALHAHPEVVSSLWFVGERPPRTYYNTTIREDRSARFAAAVVDTTGPEATAALLPRLQRSLIADFPEAAVLAIPFGQGPPIEAPIELRVFGPDLETLRGIGEHLRRLLSETPGVTFSEATVDEGRPGLVVRAEEAEARFAGLTLEGIADRLGAALDGVVGATVTEGTRTIPVRVRLADETRGHLARIAGNALLPEAPPGGAASELPPLGPPLAALARLELAPQPAAITRRDGERVNVVTAFVEPYALPAPVFAAFRKRLAADPPPLPPGYRLETGGEDEGSGEARANLLGVVAPLMVLMLGTLVLAFDSFRLAAIVAVVGALSVGSGLAAVWIFGHPLGLLAIVGCLGLFGIAINDAIVVLAALRDEPRARAGDIDAATEVVVRASRHVISTTLTTIGGFLPLIVAGGLFWPPLAVAMAGGLVGATLLALFFVPPCYLLLATRRRPATA